MLRLSVVRRVMRLRESFGLDPVDPFRDAHKSTPRPVRSKPKPKRRRRGR